MSRTPVFISWSGKRSRRLADALRWWLPRALQGVDAWSAGTDVRPGARWGPEIAARLATTHIGLICITSENRNSPWLHFEAGALAKQVADDALVLPLLFGLAPSEIEPPLSQFQARQLDESGLLDVIDVLNSCLEDPLSPDALADQFKLLWPDLQARLSRIGSPPDEEQRRAPSPRTRDQVLDELLEIARRLDQHATIAGHALLPTFGRAPVDEIGVRRERRSPTRYRDLTPMIPKSVLSTIREAADEILRIVALQLHSYVPAGEIREALSKLDRATYDVDFFALPVDVRTLVGDAIKFGNKAYERSKEPS